jgi:glycosyltransferase involved in cell wall biosynthesis
MKIVYVSDSAIPSSSPNSLHVMKMCQAFGRLGHSVTLWAKNTTFCIKDVQDIHAFYAVDKNFDIDIYPTTAYKVSGLLYNIKLGYRVLNISADLIYTRSIIAAFFLLLYNKPVAFEVHEPFEGKGARLRRMFKYIIEHPKLLKLVVISAALKTYYQENFNLHESRIAVAHDGADPFPSVQAATLTAGFKVGYVGSLYPGKGMEIILPLAKKCPAIQFHIVGGKRDQIENIRKDQQLANVEFHGFKTQQEIPPLLKAFDILIAPYTRVVKVSRKKGANNLALWMSPLKLFEYMAAGKPIVTSNLAVIQEIIEHNKTGVLCDPDDLQSWVVAISNLRDNPDVAKDLARQARETFENHHTWEKRAAAILKELNV